MKGLRDLFFIFFVLQQSFGNIFQVTANTSFFLPIWESDLPPFLPGVIGFFSTHKAPRQSGGATAGTQPLGCQSCHPPGLAFPRTGCDVTRQAQRVISWFHPQPRGWRMTVDDGGWCHRDMRKKWPHLSYLLDRACASLLPWGLLANTAQQIQLRTPSLTVTLSPLFAHCCMNNYKFCVFFFLFKVNGAKKEKKEKKVTEETGAQVNVNHLQLCGLLDIFMVFILCILHSEV